MFYLYHMTSFAKTRFLGAFLKNSRSTGSVTPSSKFLVNKLLEGVNLSKAKVVIELGPGEGVFTRQILKRISDDAQLYCIELNDKFAAELQKIDDARLTVIQDSAIQVADIMRARNMPSSAVILSSLPISNFDATDRATLLTTCAELIGSQGTFLQYQYSKKNLKEIQQYFGFVHVSREWRNVPPAWCYTCKNQSNDAV